MWKGSMKRLDRRESGTVRGGEYNETNAKEFARGFTLASKRGKFEKSEFASERIKRPSSVARNWSFSSFQPALDLN